MMTKVLVAVMILGIAVISLIIGFITPAEAGPFGIMALFVAVYATLVSGVALLIFYGTRLVRFLLKQLTGRTIVTKVSLIKSYYYATVVALLPMMLVGLHAAGGVTGYGLLLVIVFGAIGIFYIAKRG